MNVILWYMFAAFQPQDVYIADLNCCAAENPAYHMVTNPCLNGIGENAFILTPKGKEYVQYPPLVQILSEYALERDSNGWRYAIRVNNISVRKHKTFKALFQLSVKKYYITS